VYDEVPGLEGLDYIEAAVSSTVKIKTFEKKNIVEKNIIIGHLS
jgi:hypothetical protein